MYGRRTGRIKKIVRKWGVFMSAILKQKLIDIANGFTKYGLWKGGGSGGSSALSEMTDVTFTDLQTNDILKYNGSVWVNGNNLPDYSTEEKIVGTWIDGKPIYQKSYFIPNTVVLNTNWASIIKISENVKYLVYSMIYDPNYYNNMYLIRYREGYLEGLAPLTIGINSNSYVTIQYTKTTD